MKSSPSWFFYQSEVAKYTRKSKYMKIIGVSIARIHKVKIEVKH